MVMLSWHCDVIIGVIYVKILFLWLFAYILSISDVILELHWIFKTFEKWRNFGFVMNFFMKTKIGYVIQIYNSIPYILSFW